VIGRSKHEYAASVYSPDCLEGRPSRKLQRREAGLPRRLRIYLREIERHSPRGEVLHIRDCRLAFLRG
jgi:hypothetical protein